MMSNVCQKECLALSNLKIVFFKNLFDLVIRFYWCDEIRILTQRVHTFNIFKICNLNDHDQRDLEMRYDENSQEVCLINSCNTKKDLFFEMVISIADILVNCFVFQYLYHNNELLWKVLTQN